jgi:magnesium transporter
MIEVQERLTESVSKHIHKNVPWYHSGATVQHVIEHTREHGQEQSILYFYVVNEQEQLVGVVPTRRILLSPPDAHLSDIMVKRVVSLPQNATVADACELFIMHRFLAFPVLDANRKFLGVVDIQLFTEEAIELSERGAANDVFQWIGIHLEELQHATPFHSYRVRMPWLLATVFSGLLCALLAHQFEGVISRILLLSSFLPVVLGISESVSVQAMTVSIQSLHKHSVTTSEIIRRLLRDAISGILIAASCGAIIMVAALFWNFSLLVPLIIGGSVAFAIISANVIGFLVPVLLHSNKRDPKIASGPIALALTDIIALSIYFGSAALFT